MFNLSAVRGAFRFICTHSPLCKCSILEDTNEERVKSGVGVSNFHSAQHTSLQMCVEYRPIFNQSFSCMFSLLLFFPFSLSMIIYFSRAEQQHVDNRHHCYPLFGDDAIARIVWQKLGLCIVYGPTLFFLCPFPGNACVWSHMWFKCMYNIHIFIMRSHPRTYFHKLWIVCEWEKWTLCSFLRCCVFRSFFFIFISSVSRCYMS